MKDLNFFSMILNHLNYTMFYYYVGWISKPWTCYKFKLHNVLLLSRGLLKNAIAILPFKLHNVLLLSYYYSFLINSSIFSYNLSIINFYLFFNIHIFTEIINSLFLLHFIYLSNPKHSPPTAVRQILEKTHF